MDRNVVVVYDACVLFPAPLRDILMELGVLAHKSKLFRPKWTNRIHEEWISNLLEERKELRREDLERTRLLMDRAFEDQTPLVAGYEHRIKSLSLPDEKDKHVLAAAIECGASIIITANLKDFPDRDLKHCGVVAKHPDDFLCEFLDDHEVLAEKLIERAARNIKRRLKSPPLTWNEIFESYRRNGLVQFVERLNEIIPTSEIENEEKESVKRKKEEEEGENARKFKSRLNEFRQKRR